MYRCLSIILLIFSFSCGKKEDKQIPVQNNDSIQFKIDSFNFEYTKQGFQLIIDSFPQLSGKNGIIEHPDSAYLKYPVFVNGYTFGSEAGQDEFYILYTYFLRKKNGDKYNKERDNLINIYRKLNEFYQELNRGGTYFGHMFGRIVGYAEYDIYNLSITGINQTIKDISYAKQNFLKSLKKDIDKRIEESSSDFGEDVKTDQLQEYVNELNNMLSNEFYLSKVDDFKKKYYNY